MKAVLFASYVFIGTLLAICDCYNESYVIQEMDTKHSTAFVVVYGIPQTDGTVNFNVNYDEFQGNKFQGDLLAGSWMNADNNKTGWAYQIIRTNVVFNDTLQAYWAGYLEGQTALNLSKAQFRNTLSDFCPKPYSDYCIRLATYLNDNVEWMKSMVVKNRMTDPFWHQVELQLWQIKGLQDAFKQNKLVKNSRELSLEAFKNLDISGYEVYLFQLGGDLDDLASALNKKGARAHITGNGRCSALIKLLPGNRDLYAAHDTWSTYQSMLRVLKHYDFQFRMTAQKDSPIVPGHKMSFSSYPSTASSIDDFYVMSSGLVTIETTNGNYNTSLWKIVENGAKSSVLEYMRVQIANRLATNGAEWVKYFSRRNSGTYNNQWMVVDYKKFTPGQQLPKTGVLTVAEQLPGIVVSKDLTESLKENGYWASYNIPAFKKIYDLADYPSQAKKYGDWFTHSGSPRARIFKRDQGKVNNLQAMMKIMRYNNFQKDPLSRCKCTPPYSAENAISARCDLNPANGTYPFGALGHRSHGGIDMKVTNASMVRNMNFIAINGPTYDQVPVFEWSKSDFAKTTPHFMHPDKFAFPPVLTPFHPKMQHRFESGKEQNRNFDRL